jgi:hypothetical protein
MRPRPRPYPDLTDTELRAGLDLLPTWALQQKPPPYLNQLTLDREEDKVDGGGAPRCRAHISGSCPVDAAGSGRGNA